MAKKINGLMVKFSGKYRSYLVKGPGGKTIDRFGYKDTAEHFAAKDRRFVSYQAGIGGDCPPPKKKKA